MYDLFDESPEPKVDILIYNMNNIYVMHKNYYTIYYIHFTVY